MINNRFLLVASALFFIFLSTQAQEKLNNSWTPYIGASIAWNPMNNDYAGRAKVGKTIGVRYKLNFKGKDSNHFAFEPGLSYVEKGESFNISSNKTGTDIYKYLELPMLFSFNIKVYKGFSLEVSFGGFLSYGIQYIGINKTPTLTTIVKGSEIDFFKNKYLKRFDAGLQGGIGCTIHDHYSLRILYAHSLIQAAKTESFPNTRNSAVYLTLGYTF